MCHVVGDLVTSTYERSEKTTYSFLVQNFNFTIFKISSFCFGGILVDEDQQHVNLEERHAINFLHSTFCSLVFKTKLDKKHEIKP